MKRVLAILLTLALCLCAPCALADRSETSRVRLSGISDAGRNNVELAASSISGVTIPYGAAFSFNESVGPRSERYGYESAPNGRDYEVCGGGVARCASVLYLALRAAGADVEYTGLQSYGPDFSQDYVDDPADAIAVDYNAGLDFSFVNYDDSLYIEMWTTDSYLYCSVTLEREAAHRAAPARDGYKRRPAAMSTIWIDGDDNLYNNILHAASSINDTVLPPGALFSFNGTVGPRTEDYGYREAVNGRGSIVVGGGVAQVASAIYMAVKNLDDVAIVEKTTYGSRYNQEYVSSSNDAILTDYAGGTDFSFRNTGDAAMMISTYISGDSLCCEIYYN